MKRFTLPILLIFLMSASFPAIGQQPCIKALKQRTSFFYANLNLQAGVFNENDETHWLPINRSPLNQVSISFKSKNQRLLQKGFTPFLHLGDIKAKVSLAYDNDMSSEGDYTSELKFSVQDFWFKLVTKWDRTALKIGNFSLPFGHNPKIDPDYSFIPNIGGTDLGLSRDFGVLFKTPVSSSLDLELALTSGGLFKSPVMTGKVVALENAYEDKWLNFSQIDYNGDWLFTLRMGNPVFKVNEFGWFAIVGKMTPSNDVHSNRVYRVGFDWIHKNKEQFRITNQLLLGPTIAHSDGSQFKIIQQTNAEFFMARQWIFYLTNNVQYISEIVSDSNDSIIKGSFAGGLAFAINPHTRIKLNVYSNHNFTESQYDFGAFLQFVTGFGLRG